MPQSLFAREFFYRPAGAWAADFIPLYANGEFHLFYLHDWRNKEAHGEGTPWYKVTSTDFVHFQEYGEMLPRGAATAQDLYVFTGSALEAEGRYHIYYTGHNPYFRAQGKPQEAVLHAVSSDLLHWSKRPDEAFVAPSAAGYEPHDWRDPFVFWNAEAKEYWMLLAARRTTGPERRRGCTALAASKDLRNWEVREPFWAPGTFFTHECPDLFRTGDWWYLVFSEFSEQFLTQYRKARSLKGPWITPKNKSFDGRAYYAAKTASDGRKRFLFGWLATRTGAKDYAGWNWGGNLVVHELVQQPDGDLAVRVPETVNAAFGAAHPAALQAGLGELQAGRLNAPGSFGCALAGPMPDRCRIDVTVTFEAGTRGCGLLLRSSDDYQSGYYVRLEPLAHRLVVDAYPRQGDIPFMVELERPMPLQPGRRIHLKVLVDGSCCVIYAGDTFAVSTRLYDLKAGRLGVFVNDGTALFSGLSITA